MLGKGVLDFEIPPSEGLTPAYLLLGLGRQQRRPAETVARPGMRPRTTGIGSRLRSPPPPTPPQKKIPPIVQLLFTPHKRFFLAITPCKYLKQKTGALVTMRNEL